MTEINVDLPLLAWALRDYLADRNGGIAPSSRELLEEFQLLNYYLVVNAPRSQFPPMEAYRDRD